jgi:hypothetical protein
MQSTGFLTARAAALCIILTAPLAWSQVAEIEWTIEGRVVDASTGQPLKDVEMTGTGTENLGQVRTDAEGRYRYNGRKNGLYIIRGEKEGYGDYNAAMRRAVRVTAGETVKGIDLALLREAVVTGRVLNSEKKPIFGAKVDLLVRNGEWDGVPRYRTPGSATTGADGSYEIRGMGEGRHLLRVLTPPVVEMNPAAAGARRSGPLRMLFYVNGRGAAEASPLELRAGVPLEHIDMVLPEAPTVCVNAEGPAAKSESGTVGVGVMIQDQDSGTYSTVTSALVAPGARVRFCGLPPGRYLALTYVYLKDHPQHKVIALGRREFEARREDADLGVLPIDASADLPGRVVVEGASRDEAPPAGIHVELLARRNRLPGDAWLAYLKPNATFLFKDVLADAYQISATQLPRRHWVSRISQEGWDAPTGTVRPGGAVTITLRSDGPILSGVAVDAKDHPVLDAMVCLVAQDAPTRPPVQIARTDQNGRFEFSAGLAPGTYKVFALDGLPPAMEGDWALIRERAVGARELKLTAGADQQVTLVVQR